MSFPICNAKQCKCNAKMQTYSELTRRPRALRRVSDLSDRQEREAVQLVDLKRSFDMHTAVQAAVKQDVQSINKGVSHFFHI